VPIDADALPNDPIVLQEMLRELYAENDKLRLMIQRLTRHQFGRRSEQLRLSSCSSALKIRNRPLLSTRRLRMRPSRPSTLSHVPEQIAVLPAITEHCRRICRATRW
jgi:hypothetical protein